MAVRIIYYVNGRWPSIDELDEGRAIGAVFRNARLVSQPEACDYVAGAVPDCCAHLPRWSSGEAAAIAAGPRMPKKRRGKPRKRDSPSRDDAQEAADGVDD